MYTWRKIFLFCRSGFACHVRILATGGKAHRSSDSFYRVREKFDSKVAWTRPCGQRREHATEESYLCWTLYFHAYSSLANEYLRSNLTGAPWLLACLLSPQVPLEPRRAFVISLLISPVIIGEVFNRLALRLAGLLVVVRELVSILFEKLQF